MLCVSAQGLEITVSGIRADEHTGAAHWEARYTFSQTGRKIHNKIDAAFQFANGKIIAHRDTFDLWRWARMALGVKGILFGWLPSLQAKIRSEANKRLELFMNKTESAATPAQ